MPTVNIMTMHANSNDAIYETIPFNTLAERIDFCHLTQQVMAYSHDGITWIYPY